MADPVRPPVVADAHAGALLQWLDLQAAGGVLSTDRDLIVRSWNRWLVNATGRDRDAVIGRPLFEVVPSLRQRGLDAQYLDALNGEVVILSHALHKHIIECRRADGELMPQRGRIGPLLDGDRIVGTV